MNSPVTISKILRPEDVSRCVCFHQQDKSLDQIQSAGAAALWNTIHEKGFAYLADEVGMGKTWQAMGVIALQFLRKPDSRVAIVCPGADLQKKWVQNWQAFTRHNCLIYNNIIRDAWKGGQALQGKYHDRLRDFAEDLVLDTARLHVLRYSSFSRPLWFGGLGQLPGKNEIEQYYRECLRNIGYPDLDEDEKKIFKKFHSNIAELTRELNHCYSLRVGKIVDDARPMDLLICDESQYLRHIKNARNTNLRLVFCQKNLGGLLFMSATPFHRDEQDVMMLDNYLANPLISTTRKAHNDDMVKTMETFMVRRMRTYVDKNKRKYNKHMYRNYGMHDFDGRDDPFYALTLGLVQKRLVKALGGKNNEFRIGECSSFESLQESVIRKSINRDGQAAEETEFENTETANRDQRENSPDRDLINGMAKRFRRKMKSCLGVQHPQLPHAKVDEMVKILSDNHINGAPCCKALVFVRRLGTVDELISRLNTQFQQSIDIRIKHWLDCLNSPGSVITARDYWKLGPRQDDEDPTFEGDDHQGSEIAEGSEQHTNFTNALRRSAKGTLHKTGMLASFQSQLLSTDKRKESHLNFLLQKEPRKKWLRLCSLVGIDESDLNEILEKAQDSGRADVPDTEDVLKRCILQAMRRSDLIVDLDIIRRFIVKGKARFSEVLFECLEGTFCFFNGRSISQNPFLKSYFDHWKERINRWIIHIGTIMEQSLSHINIDTWKREVDKLFYHTGPIAGRSGRIQTTQTVPQFKLPSYPNVLVCTDVLREGIDLHLFCDQIYHYGVAWTSGDLEQRIGRIDRFGSLISRNISNFSDNEPMNVPRLSVGYPRLVGSLDSLQVERVYKRKLESDLTLDFGENRQEKTSITIDDLRNRLQVCAGVSKSGIFNPRFSSEKPSQPGIDFPGSLLEPDPEIIRKANEIKEQVEHNLGQDRWIENIIQVPEEASRYLLDYLPELGLFRLTRRVDCDSMPDTNANRWLFLIKESKYRHYAEYDLLIGLDSSIEACIKAFLSTKDPMCSYGLGPGKQISGFTHDYKLGTMSANIELENPCNPQLPRGQSVFIERYQSIYFLKSFIASDQGGHIERYGNSLPARHMRGWQSALVNLNKSCRYGHFHYSGSNLFYVLPIHDLALLSDGKLLQKVAIYADRIQLLMTAADGVIDGYRSLQSIELLCDSYGNSQMKDWKKTIKDLKGDT